MIPKRASANATLTFVTFVTLFDLPQNTNNDKTRQLYTKANESGEEAQKEAMRLIDIGLPQSKSKVNSNSKARIESKIQ